MHREQADYLHLRELGGLELLKLIITKHNFQSILMKDIVLVSLKRVLSLFRTGQLHVAPKGDIILVNADEIHTGSSAVESGWRYRAIYPTPEMLAEVSQDF